MVAQGTQIIYRTQDKCTESITCTMKVIKPKKKGKISKYAKICFKGSHNNTRTEQDNSPSLWVTLA